MKEIKLDEEFVIVRGTDNKYNKYVAKIVPDYISECKLIIVGNLEEG